VSRTGTTETVVAIDREDSRLTQHVGISGMLTGFFSRVRAGDIGSLPIVVGLILIWGIIQGLNSSFLSSRNLVNLATQCASDGIIAVGVVLVLLVAQIDLSVGSMSGVASSILGIGLTTAGWPLPVAIAVALAAGVVVGLIYAVIFVRFNVPTFVVTLAGLLALLGLQLQLLGKNGSINIPFNSAMVGFMQRMFVPSVLSYVLAAVVAVGFVGTQLRRTQRRRAAHLSTRSISSSLVKGLVLLAGLEVVCWYLNETRGVSLPFVLLVVVVVVVDFALKRTRWGRAVYAVGGSVEAARRAGVKLGRIYVSVFVLCSMFAALGGLMSAGRLSAATISSGTGDTNLNAIAAAVIGGTSLFGGRGNAYSALLGIVVIESIANGLTLLNLTSAIRFMITGGVLMIAVIVDSMARRTRAAHGAA
jgi:simple sugar transport system permease protein/D-xylose transport system permease protein